MRRFIGFVLSVAVLLCLIGCDGGSLIFQSQITIVTEEVQSDDSTTTSKKQDEKSSTIAPTSSEKVSSKPDTPSKPETTVFKEITTPDGEKAVEITNNKNNPTPSDNSSSGGSSDDTQDSGPALPPSIEDLENMHPDSDTTEPISSTQPDSSETDDSSTTSVDSNSESAEPSEDDTAPAEHIPVSFEERYRYNLLSITEKVLYRQIRNATENFEYKVRFMQPHTFAEVATVLDAVIADHPEYFYLCSRAIIMHDGNGNAGQINLMFSDSVNTNTDSDGYCIEVSSTLKSSILAKQTAFNAKTQSILSKIDPALPDIQKEKIIYDTLLLQAEYNLGSVWSNTVPNTWTAYGVLVNSSGVCESYSEAFQHLCLSVGINCTVVRGDAGGAHQWNAIRLDGEWYECDLTFDDPIKSNPSHSVFIYHNYFNLTTEQMNKLNHFAYSDEPSPIATGTKYSYKNYFNTKYMY